MLHILDADVLMEMIIHQLQIDNIHYKMKGEYYQDGYAYAIIVLIIIGKVELMLINLKIYIINLMVMKH